MSKNRYRYTSTPRRRTWPNFSEVGKDLGTGGVIASFIANVGQELLSEGMDEHAAAVSEEFTNKGFEAGRTAVEAGQAMPQMDEDTLAAQKFNQAVATEYLGGIELRATEGVRRLAMNHPNDPDSFTKRFEGMRKGLIEGIPVNLRSGAGMTLDRLYKRTLTDIQGNVLKEAEDEANANLITQTTRHFETANHYWRAGDETAGLVAEEAARASILARTDLSETRKQTILSERDKEKRRQAVFGEFERATNGGYGQATDFVRGFVASHQDIEPNERDALATELMGRLSKFKVMQGQVFEDLRNRASVALEAMGKGRKAEGLDGLLEEADAIGDVETAKKIRLGLALNDEAVAFGRLTPQEQAIRIENLKENVSTDYDNDRLDVFGRIHQDTVKGLQQSSLQLVKERGIEDVPDLDFSSAEAFVGSLQERFATGRRVQTRYGMAKTPIMTKEESKAVSAMIEQAPIAERAGYLSLLRQGLPEQHMPVLLETLSQNKPEYAHAAAHMYEGNSAAAIAILEGEEISRLEKQFLPKNTVDYKDGLLDKLHGGGLVLDALDSNTRAGIEKAVKAAYTKLSRDENDVSGDVDTERLQAAVDLVTGGVVEYDRPGVTGENFKTLAPWPGMSSDAFTDILDELRDEQLGPTGPLDATGRRIPLDAIRRDGVLMVVGKGRYSIRFYDTDRRTFYNAVTKDNRAYILDLNVLLNS